MRDDLRAQLVSEKIFEKVTASVTVSDAEIEKYYDEEQGAVQRSRQPRRAPHPREDEGAGGQLYTQLKNGAEFATLAKKYSQDTGSKAHGGKLTISKGQTVPPFDKVGVPAEDERDLEAGADAVRLAHHPAARRGQAREDDAAQGGADAIRQQLLQQKKNDAMTKWVDELKRSYTDEDHVRDRLHAAATATTRATTSGDEPVGALGRRCSSSSS